MDKESFLRELEYLLSGVPGVEQEEALSFYRDYFEEAGPEREAEILEGLGSPAKVAAEILGNLSGSRDAGEFTETGYRDQRFEEKGNVPDQYAKIVRAEARDSEEGRTKAAEAVKEDRKSGEDGGAGRTNGDSQTSGGGSRSQSRTGEEKEWEGSQAYTGDVEWTDREKRAGHQGEEWKRRAEEAWNTARDSEWGRKAEGAWNSARDSEWGRKAEEAWNSARESARQRREERESSGGETYRRENGWKNGGGQEYEKSGKREYQNFREDQETRNTWSEGRSGKPARRRNGNKLLVLLLFLFFGLPLAGSIISAGFSVAAAVIGGIFGIFGGLFGLIAAGIGGICAAFAAGIALIASGICNIAVPAVGIMLIGLGLLAFAGVFLLIILVKWGCVVAVPGVFRLAAEITRKMLGFVFGLVRRLFGRGGEA